MVVNIDILVVGGGPIGLTAACWFAKQGNKVVVVEKRSKETFADRSNQIGLKAQTLSFLLQLSSAHLGRINEQCPDSDHWRNIKIGFLQQLLYDTFQEEKETQVYFETNFVSTAENPLQVTFKTKEEEILDFRPRLVIVADGNTTSTGVATAFGFQLTSPPKCASRGIVATFTRSVATSITCLPSVSVDDFQSPLLPELGEFHVRIIGSLQERYIAVGLANNNPKNIEAFKTAMENETLRSDLLKEAFLKYQTDVEREYPQPEMKPKPVPIEITYRSETIKLDGGAIISVEGDAARRTTFFTGSGFNTGVRSLQQLFSLWAEFKKGEDLITLIQLKSKQAAELSNELALNACGFIQREKNPTIQSLSPSCGPTNLWVYLHGFNFQTPGLEAFISFNGGEVTKAANFFVYSSTEAGIKIPQEAVGIVTIRLKAPSGVTTERNYETAIVAERPLVTAVDEHHGVPRWFYIRGNNFDHECTVIISSSSGTEWKIQPYLYSFTSLGFALPEAAGDQVSLKVRSTSKGESGSLMLKQ